MTDGPRHVPGTTPYPWPWRGLEADRLALLVVTAPLVGAVTTAPIREAATTLAGYGVPTVQVCCSAPPARRPVPSGEPTLVCAGGDLTVAPAGWDGFHGTALDGWLRAGGRDHLVIAGWWTEIGVHSTMRSANDRGYECLLATDLCTGLDPVTTAATVSSTEMSGGIFGAVGTFSSLLTLLDGQDAP